MKPEQLLILASARGMRLDLGRPRRNIPKEHRSAPRRRNVGEKGKGDRGIPGILTADGTEDRPRTKPEWTGPELGLAAAGMPEPWWRTLCWAIGLEEPARVWLKYRLLELAVEHKEREQWPAKLRRGDCGTCGAMRCSHRYLEDLCVLALQEIAHPGEFSTDAARARFFSIAEHHWRRTVSRYYGAVHTPIRDWYQSAERYLRMSLREINDEQISARDPA